MHEKTTTVDPRLPRPKSAHRLNSLPCKSGKTFGVKANINPILISRIIDFYQLTAVPANEAGISQWTQFEHTLNTDVLRLLRNRNAKEVANCLANPAENNCFYGFENIRKDITCQCESDPSAWVWYAENIQDNLLCLAEATGIVPLQNPESSFVHDSEKINTETILRNLDILFGFRIEFPNPYPDEYGLATERGVASYRSIQALWQAWRIYSKLKNPSSAHVVEIGAGLGRTAYYANKFGIGTYEIVDIPFTAVSSAFFLANAIGESSVELEGENMPNASVRIISPDAFFARSDTVDLVVNFDSFTEIDNAIAARYWEKIFLISYEFLSINHEVNEIRVSDYYRNSLEKYSFERVPCWLRRGYVEEFIYKHS